MAVLSGKRILAFTGDDYEDLELWYPVLRLREAGAEVCVAGLQANHSYRGKNGYPSVSDVSVTDVKARDYHGLVVPGGWMPDKLRRDPKVLEITRHFAESGKMIAAICHGPWILISAGVCRGVRMTSTPAIKDDLINAGAEWKDAELVVDRHFISSRRPADLPAFCASMVEYLGG